MRWMTPSCPSYCSTTSRWCCTRMAIDGHTVLTGSFNFTTQAEHENAENLLILRGQRELARQYRADFDAHKAHSRAAFPQAHHTSAEHRRHRERSGVPRAAQGQSLKPASQHGSDWPFGATSTDGPDDAAVPSARLGLCQASGGGFVQRGEPG